jgi:hypothetical protein
MKPIPTKVHGLLDYTTGALFIASPWLFGFAKRIRWPHLTFGLLEVGAGLLTQRKPAYEK